MGPGTKITTNIITDVPFVNEVDHAALHHDIDYITAQGNYGETVKADLKAIKNSDFSLGGLLMKGGLTLRSALSTVSLNNVSFSNNKLTQEEAQILRDELLKIHNAKYHVQNPF